MINQTVKALHLLQETDQDASVILVQNSQIVKIFGHITSYTKTKDQRALFGMILKTGRSFVDQFAKHSIPFFTNVFRSHKNEIVDILKDFQKSTRALQVRCIRERGWVWMERWFMLMMTCVLRRLFVHMSRWSRMYNYRRMCRRWRGHWRSLSSKSRCYWQRIMRHPTPFSWVHWSTEIFEARKYNHRYIGWV